MAPPRTLRVAPLACIACPLLLAAPAARATENWNQWDAPAVSAVGQGATRLSIGVDWASVPGDHTIRLAGTAEHFLRDRWSLAGRVGLPLGGEWIAPAVLEVRFHVLPRAPLDLHVGAGGGFAWFRPDGRANRVDPTASGEVGLAFHYFGMFFLEAQGRYDVVRYAASDGAIDRSGFAVAGGTGVYF